MEILLLVGLKIVMEQCIGSKTFVERKSPSNIGRGFVRDSMRKVIFSKRAYTALCTELHMFDGEETGGIFIGYYEDNTYYIVENIFSGPYAKHKSAEYICDFDYVNYQANMLAAMYAKKIDVIGIWHSHVTSSPFSIADEHTNQQFAQLNEYGALSCLIDMQNKLFFIYIVSPEGEYTSLTYEVLDETEFHYRELFLFEGKEENANADN